MADGVSVKRRSDGRWRVRWRERVASGGGWRWASRERVVSDETTAQRLADKIRRARELGELPELEPVRVAPEVATVDAVLAGYGRSLAARGRSVGTIRAFTTDAGRLLGAIRSLRGVPTDRAVPGGLLTRDTVFEVTTGLRRAGLSESTVYRSVRTLVAAWRWATDDPGTYPGLAPPPRDTGSVLPAAPVYAPIMAPTMAEVDACLRRIAALPKSAAIGLPVAVISRCTGLRVSQILALRVGDVALTNRSLTVTRGKSRAEAAERRTVPYAPALHDFLVPLVAGRDPEAPVVRRRFNGAASRFDAKSARAAWEAATVAGEVRRAAWDPPGRLHARSDHAFRAAFQHALVLAGVRDEVIDTLVGHRGGLRATHYVAADARWQAMTEAVALIPPIDWGESASNVIPIR